MPFNPDSAFEEGPSYASLVRADKRLTEAAYAVIEALDAELDRADVPKTADLISVERVETPIEDVETMLEEVEAMVKDIEASVKDTEAPQKPVQVPVECIKATVVLTDTASKPIKEVLKPMEAVPKPNGAANKPNEGEALSEQKSQVVPANVDAKAVKDTATNVTASSMTTSVGDIKVEKEDRAKDVATMRKATKTSGPASILCGGPCGKCKPTSQYHAVEVKAYLDPLNSNPIRCMLCCMPASSNGAREEIQENDGEFVFVDIDTDDDDGEHDSDV